MVLVCTGCGPNYAVSRADIKPRLNDPAPVGCKAWRSHSEAVVYCNGSTTRVQGRNAVLSTPLLLEDSMQSHRETLERSDRDGRWVESLRIRRPYVARAMQLAPTGTLAAFVFHREGGVIGFSCTVDRRDLDADAVCGPVISAMAEGVPQSWWQPEKVTSFKMLGQPLRVLEPCGPRSPMRSSA